MYAMLRRLAIRESVVASKQVWYATSKCQVVSDGCNKIMRNILFSLPPLLLQVWNLLFHWGIFWV